MRKISVGPIVVFTLIFCLTMSLAIVTTNTLLGSVPMGDFRGITLVVAALLFLYVYSIIVYRLFLYIMPLKEGYIEEGSKEEFGHNIYILFFLILFRPLIGTKLIPIPVTRVIYLCLGARLGSNTYSAGTILDPPLTLIGANTIIGHDAVLYSHAIEGRRLSNAAIHIGDNVTIGAKSVIMSGVEIDDGAIIAAGSVVLKDTQIGPDELWGGVPARCLRKQTHSNRKKLGRSSDLPSM